MEGQEIQIQNQTNDVSGNVNVNGSGNGGGGGGSRSSKKAKQKKVPQRGLGVAQLEKLRIEELQKKTAATILSQQQNSIQNFHDSNQPPPPPARSQPEFRSVSVQQKVPCTGTVPLTNTSAAMQFLPSFPYESNHVWPLPNLGHRAPQFHYQLPSSMANVSPAGISSTPSPPVPNFSREPPSNQNCDDNNGLLGRQAAKIVGVKRPYPFCLDAPPVPAFTYKLHPFSEMQMNATTFCASGFNYDASNSTLRELPSCSASNSEINSRKRNKESENFNGDFLSLAPPTPTSCPPSRMKPLSSFLAFPNQDYPEFESQSFQGTLEDQVPPPQPRNRFNQPQQPFYCFFPPAASESQIGQTTARTQSANGVKENIDLNLKLGK